VEVTVPKRRKPGIFSNINKPISNVNKPTNHFTSLQHINKQYILNSTHSTENYGRRWARISLSRGSVLSREYFPSSCNCFPKMADFSRLGALQAVTYTLKVVVSKKWHEIDTLLLYTPLIGTIIMLIYLCHFLEGHSLNARLIKCNLTNICDI